ncbi:hypothetical protein RRG08_046151 [Elysia crispata]|uniref:Uncharacterized protein n=1 Tax=Elysia crispata TaxID=231223 RepID=A0AAE1A6C3_9GAST|nr:hypothetical protein RRG08_046151 [Elysia crispata]
MSRQDLCQLEYQADLEASVGEKRSVFELIETLNSAPSLPQGIRSILGEVGTGSELVAQGSVTERRFYWFSEVILGVLIF